MSEPINPRAHAPSLYGMAGYTDLEVLRTAWHLHTTTPVPTVFLELANRYANRLRDETDHALPAFYQPTTTKENNHVS